MQLVQVRINIRMRIKRINKPVYALHELKQIASLNTLLMAYHDLVTPLIFWGNSTYIDFILEAQKRCIINKKTSICLNFK